MKMNRRSSFFISLCEKALKHLYILVPILMGLIISLKVVYPYTITPGGDIVAHVYKVDVLMKQMRHEGFLFWGSWDWDWNCGYPFLKAYPPLFYFVAAIVSFALNTSSLVSVKMLSFLSYPLATLMSYLFIKQVTKDKLASLVGSCVYTYAPVVIAGLTINGSPLYPFAIALIPLPFLFVEKLIEIEGRSLTYFYLTTIFLAITVLVHFGFMNYILYFFLYLLLKYFFVEKFNSKIFLSIPLAITLTCFSILPAFLYLTTMGTPSWFELKSPAAFFLDLFSPATGVGPIAFILGVVVAPLIFLKCKDRRYLPYLFCIGIALSQFFAIYILPDIPALNYFIGWNAAGPIRLFSSVLSAYVISKIPRYDKVVITALITFRKRVFTLRICEKELLVFTVILFTLINLGFVPLYFPPEPNRYIGAYEFVRSPPSYRETLFSDYFADDLSMWAPVSGNWTIEDGKLSSSGSDEEVIVAGEKLSDYIFQVKAKWVAGVEGYIGLLFKYFDEENHYRFYADNYWTDLSVMKVVNGTVNRLATKEFSLAEDRWYVFKVEVKRMAIECYINGELFFNVTDNAFTGGKVGLRTFKTRAYLDNVEVYVKIFNEYDWFRIWQIPPQPTLGTIPTYTQKPTVSGWFHQGRAKENSLFISSFVYDRLKTKLNDTGSPVRALRIFNVKYIIADEADPVYSRKIVSNITENLRKSDHLDIVHRNGSIYVFELKDTHPLITSTNIFVITPEDELSTFYQIVSNESFKQHLGVFLSEENNLEGVMYKEWNGYSSYDGYVNTTIHSIEVNGMSMEFNLTVDRDCFVSIPISSFTGLKTEVDGREVKMYKALPAFIALQLSAGTHFITIYRFVTPLEMMSITITTATFIGLIILLAVDFIKNRRACTRAKNTKTIQAMFHHALSLIMCPVYFCRASLRHPTRKRPLTYTV